MILLGKKFEIKNINEFIVWLMQKYWTLFPLWDTYKYNNNVLPKPLFFGAKEGSIFFYEVSSVNEQVINDIANYELTGVSPFNYAGINHFKVIDYVWDRLSRKIRTKIYNRSKINYQI
jgi:hypothetical protein